MGLDNFFSRNKEEAEYTERKENKRITASQLQDNDMAILEQIESLHQKIDGMDRNNKKFLMAATMNDGRSEKLEQDIINMKMGVIELLDQIDVLLSAVFSSEAENLKKGLHAYYNKIAEIASGLGLEEIKAAEGMKFNPEEMECTEAVHLDGRGDDTVVAFTQRGYRDKNNGKLLRCAKVTVNRL